MSTATQLRERLSTVTDPELEDDLVSLGLITDVRVDDDVAIVSLAFNAPLSPTEWQMCDEVRALCRGMGLEPRLYADVDAGRSVFPGVKNVVSIGALEADAGSIVVTANLARALSAVGARVGVLDLATGVERTTETWLDAVDPPTLSSDPITPTEFRGVQTVALGDRLPGRETAPMADAVFELALPQLLDGLEWGSLDYLLVALPVAAESMTRIVLDAVPSDGTVAVAPADADPSAVRSGVQQLTEIGATVLGVLRTVETQAEADESVSDFPEDGSDLEPPILGTVPLDVAPFAAATEDAPADVSRPRVPATVEGPFGRLAATITDRVGVVNRESAAASQCV